MREALAEYRPKLYGGTRPNVRKLGQAYKGLARSYADMVDSNAADVYELAQREIAENHEHYAKRNSANCLPWHATMVPTRKGFAMVGGSNTKQGVMIRENALRLFRDEFQQTKRFLTDELGGRERYNSVVHRTQLDHTEITLLDAYHSAYMVGLQTPTKNTGRRVNGVRQTEIINPPRAISLLPPRLVVIDNAPPRG
jgi:hypothetical protein